MASPTTLQRKIATAVIGWVNKFAGWPIVTDKDERTLGNVIKRVLREHGKR